ncbi:type II toxin-antitoxin system PemK/MazF family toxin [Actinoplanes sp. G11-F43]|uniref:type II toxin-antitoxin system PemK/MazF family toxin n=1 Tax=Actinoplanes sp. G11-F43 TaxID=3424130 RepID=UPI003D3263E7
MKRGDVWTVTRFGREHSVVVVENDAIIGRYPGVLVVPLSDVHEPSLERPTLSDSDGKPLGTFLAHHVGQVDKTRLTSRTAVLDEASREFADIALRAALDL